jgi:hypothetical protein
MIISFLRLTLSFATEGRSSAKPATALLGVALRLPNGATTTAPGNLSSYCPDSVVTVPLTSVALSTSVLLPRERKLAPVPDV